MSSILGFPRIGKNRELKKALEAYWGGKCSQSELESVAKDLRARHWKIQSEAAQKGLDYVSVNDFSLYDNVLDLALVLGAKPARFASLDGLEAYFAMARGHKSGVACEMTKWFNTNYHYVVPELSSKDSYKADSSSIKAQYSEAKALGYRPKITLIGLFSFFGLSRIVDSSGVETSSAQEKASIFSKLKAAYLELVKDLSALDSKVVIEFSEPLFVRGLEELKANEFGGINVESELKEVYNAIAKSGIEAIVSTFFEHSTELTDILLQSDIAGLGLDFIYGEKNLASLQAIAKSGKLLFAGVVSGRNIWVADLESKLALLEKITAIVPKERVAVSASCSLLHTPFSKEGEDKIEKEILSWLSFAEEKIAEIIALESALKNGLDKLDSTTKAFFAENKKINVARKNSTKTNNKAVRERVASHSLKERSLPFSERIKIQKAAFNFPLLPTTTIGSFPQTSEIRALRLSYKKGQIDKAQYEEGIKAYIKDCVKFQEDAGLDVLVHGEPERNDMVEYFGEQLDGFVFSTNAWVQSYGSRCVKPPIIYGDVARPKAMTTAWISYAQSLTKKVMKGMLTGPVTILNWSFVRDDLARSAVCEQIALGIADEIDDLQKAGIRIIQVDEAAFKEGYPLRAENVREYESWALACFKTSTAVAKPEVQIHTHMCYSEFNDIIKTIEALDADVISIETARSGNTLLKVFKEVGYTHEVGPGVYDIHSPRIPSVEELESQIRALLEVLPKEQLWINPDCGLKTRKWEEVKPSLENIVSAVKKVRG